MEFEALLTSRLVCSQWNDSISNEILPYRSNLNIQLDKSKVCKKFRNGEWADGITGLWDELTVHYPDNPKKFAARHIFNWGKSDSSFKCFPLVTKLILFDCGKGSFLDFVHGMLAGLPYIRHVEIKAQNWRKHSTLHYQPSLSYRINLASWIEGMKRAAKLTTFRISIFEKRTTIKYLNFLSLSETLKLVTLDVDFSKNSGLPFDPDTVDDIFQIIVRVIQNCVQTLQYLRIKWDHRVEGDLDLVLYSRDFDPYTQFVMTVSNYPDLFRSLRLKRLSLNFPAMTFTLGNILNDVMVPFIKSQESSLEKITFSRVRWESSVRIFLDCFTPQFQEKIELGVFMVDVDTWTRDGGIKLLKSVSKVEYHALGTALFDLTTLNARKARCKDTGRVKYKKQLLTSLRFQNSVLNSSLWHINVIEIIHNFRLLQDLELIDHNVDNKESRSVTNFDLNSIFRKLIHLKSLKMTNLRGITDSGLTRLSDEEIFRMKETGVYYPLLPNRVPIIQAKSKTF